MFNGWLFAVARFYMKLQNLINSKYWWLVVLVSTTAFAITAYYVYKQHRDKRKIEEGELDGGDDTLPRTSVESPATAHFSLREFERCAKVPIELYANLQELMIQLEVIRTLCGDKVVIISSGYRDDICNNKAGGRYNSQHRYAKAADIKVDGLAPDEVQLIICQAMKNGTLRKGGLGKGKTYTHYDIGKYRIWGYDNDNNVIQASC